MPRLETHLVLNRYLHHLLGAEDFESLKNLLRPLPEGPDGSGQSYFFGRLATQPSLGIPVRRLERYDHQVMVYEARLRQARQDFQGFRYFQYLALLYAEIFLDHLSDNPVLFTVNLNRFLAELRRQEGELADFPEFSAETLRRLAFFMATGSGKTLLMHVNIWQVLDYLQRGRHPEALLPGQSQRRQFDNILLITPNEGLSVQHLAELRASGIDASLFIEDRQGGSGFFGPTVKVIEIHKLAEQASRDGVSVVLEEIGPNNLVIVDEGHKGTGSEAQTWKNRQKFLSSGGFLVEFSATFAQAIATAGKTAEQTLLHEYGQAILFDYSYAHFYADGYGKDFVVLNLQDSRPDQAHELLVGGLLAFYHQLRLYQENWVAYRPFNIEKPLWVLLGSSVNALYTLNKQKRSDVAEVVAFLKRFLEEREWAVSVIGRILSGNSGFQDAASGQDLFAPHIQHLRGQDAVEVYAAILAEVFHGSGGLEVREIKQADGELGLRLSTADEAAPYFGVINIGDTSSFKKYLAEFVDLEVQEDNFRPSQFDLVDAPASSISLLVGAKKFIEGWSSWRVSSMGLLNVGKGAGSQIIQLFGRGVRLKGKGMSLKRSDSREAPPPGIRFLETLSIFGWNANYIQMFRQIIDAEDLGQELSLRVQKMDPWPEKKLPVPKTKPGFDSARLTWRLDTSAPRVELDLTVRLAVFAGSQDRTAFREQAGEKYGAMTVDFGMPPQSLILDHEALYLDALIYKQVRGYANLQLTAQSVKQVVTERCGIRLSLGDQTPDRLHQTASEALKTYIDRFVRIKEREAESQQAEPVFLTADHPSVLDEYRIRVKEGQILEGIKQALERGLPAYDDGEPLPRLYFDRSLFTPLLSEGGRAWKQQVALHPPALNRDEQQFIRDLRTFWQRNHDVEAFAQCELYVLRNLARAGIGLFLRSDFYPDFILWLANRTTDVTRVIFVDPHGLHHGGLAGNTDKFAAMKALVQLGDRPEFQTQHIQLAGYLLTTTSLFQIVDADGRSQADLEREYPLIFQQGPYVEKLLSSA